MTVEKILNIVRIAEHNEAQLRNLRENAIDESPKHPVIWLTDIEVTSVIKTINDLLYIVKQMKMNNIDEVISTQTEVQ